MHYIKVGAATLNQTPLDWHGNQQRIAAALATARQQRISILCFPELCISGYGCEDAFLASGTLAQSQRVLLELAPQTQGMIVALGLPLLHHNRVYNTVCLVVDGQIRGFVAKRFLPSDGIHYEYRWFHRWPQDTHGETEIQGVRYPIGDIYFRCGGVRLGFEICEEAWVADRPGIKLAERGVDIILNPSASHFAFDKHAVRERFVLEGSRAFSVSYVYANLLGNEAGRAIYDGDALCASGGKILASSKRFSFADYQVISALVDVDLTRMAQARTSGWVPSQVDSRIVMPFDYPTEYPHPHNNHTLPPWEYSPTLKEEEFTRAVALGLFDYLRKSRSQGFVLSLSGGADSSAIACLVRLMVEAGTTELGIDGFCDKLSYFTLPRSSLSDVMQRMLTCVYQATENSGETTRQAAETLAKTLGAEYLEININHLVQTYVNLIGEAIGRALTWQTDDIALQNIQARSRAPSVWLLANVRNALLLATSNRSEVALGYATMDGDTCGGLSPIAGIDKDFLRTWLRWLEEQGPMQLQAIDALSLVNQQAPTAELRPQDAKQTDEADLMPYPVLNAIEKAAIRDRQTPYEIFYLLRGQYTDYTPEQLVEWIERFFQLWSRNQWKRERYAPSFHLDDENLDPKTWCRFPILSGGFAQELQEMKTRLLL